MGTFYYIMCIISIPILILSIWVLIYYTFFHNSNSEKFLNGDQSERQERNDDYNQDYYP